MPCTDAAPASCCRSPAGRRPGGGLRRVGVPPGAGVPPAEGCDQTAFTSANRLPLLAIPHQHNLMAVLQAAERTSAGHADMAVSSLLVRRLLPGVQAGRHEAQHRRLQGTAEVRTAFHESFCPDLQSNLGCNVCMYVACAQMLSETLHVLHFLHDRPLSLQGAGQGRHPGVSEDDEPMREAPAWGSAATQWHANAAARM